MSELSKQREDDNKRVVLDETWVELKLKAFKSEMRLLVALSLLANQVFSHVNIPPGLTATAGIAIFLKLVFLAR